MAIELTGRAAGSRERVAGLPRLAGLPPVLPRVHLEITTTLDVTGGVRVGGLGGMPHVGRATSRRVLLLPPHTGKILERNIRVRSITIGRASGIIHGRPWIGLRLGSIQFYFVGFRYVVLASDIRWNSTGSISSGGATFGHLVCLVGAS